MHEKTPDFLSVTSEKLEKYCESVDDNINRRTIESVTLHSKTLKILEKYARGKTSLEECHILMNNAML
ncbi:hypothetical protein ABID23_000674 [Bartonella silvatica]|uniref:Uncharacterized protein n=1 Tax=Bartonella silvatica TaxID=357760 RepID=A0ABV2HGB0_9HYPH